MCRNYKMMRNVLSTVAKADGKDLGFNDFLWAFDREQIETELNRLKSEGLIVSTLEREKIGAYKGEVTGFTDEGLEFWRLIENEGVWKRILSTLEAAQIDLSYPMLKEVCEEVVRRYVAQFIPEK